MFLFWDANRDRNAHTSPDRQNLVPSPVFLGAAKQQMQQADIVWAHFNHHSPAAS